MSDATAPRGASRDRLVGKTLAPTFIFVAYGLVEFLTKGTSYNYWLDTYLAVGGGIVSWVAVVGYELISLKVTRQSSLRMLVLLGGSIPMLYSLYGIGYLGLYNIYYSIIVSFSLLGLIFAVVCIFAGYHIAYRLQALTALWSHDRFRNLT